MITVKHKGLTTTINKQSVSGMSLDEFRAFCEVVPTFKRMLPEYREAKIRKLYGEHIGNGKKVAKSRRSDNQHDSDSDGRKSGSSDRAKQKPTSKGKDSGGTTDNPEVQE